MTTMIYDGFRYREMTPTELAEAERMEAEAIENERKRPFSQREITKMLISGQINDIAVNDQTALRMMSYYPEWESGKTYTEGFKVQFGGSLYKVTTAHTSQADWTPDVAATLYVRIDETHDGSKSDPIPYDGNMVLENGKYYTQNGVKYVCTRDTMNPVYHALSELIGLYVDIAE